MFPTVFFVLFHLTPLELGSQKEVEIMGVPKNRSSKRSPEFDWREVAYFFDIYSSHLGWHWIVWRKKYARKNDYEVVSHRNVVFISEEMATGCCRKWIKEELSYARTALTSSTSIRSWLEKQKHIQLQLNHRQNSQEKTTRRQKHRVAV